MILLILFTSRVGNADDVVPFLESPPPVERRFQYGSASGSRHGSFSPSSPTPCLTPAQSDSSRGGGGPAVKWPSGTSGPPRPRLVALLEMASSRVEA